MSNLISFITDLLPRGCVTPPVIHNWWEEAEHDYERIDGLDEVPEEVQETVKRALQQGHVDDEDWAGVCFALCWSPTHQAMSDKLSRRISNATATPASRNKACSSARQRRLPWRYVPLAVYR